MKGWFIPSFLEARPFPYFTFFHHCPFSLAFVANVAPITVQIYV